MVFSAETKVGEIAAALPAALKILDYSGVDYCCASHRTLGEACRRSGVAVEQILHQIDEMGSDPAPTPNYVGMALSELVRCILDSHHAHARREIIRLGRLLDRLRRVHAEAHPELMSIGSTFFALCDELSGHMLKEERVLFPYANELENAKNIGEKLDRPPFWTVSNPIQSINEEHQTAKALLKQLRDVTNSYVVSVDWCLTHVNLIRGLHDLEQHLLDHMRTETETLFPRMAEIEKSMLKE